MSEKTCSKCNTVKTLIDFIKCKKSKSGYGSWCKKCNAFRNRAENIKNLDEIRKREAQSSDPRGQQERRKPIVERVDRIPQNARPGPRKDTGKRP